jgi:predicted CXXCH cytochrome family protein
MYRLQIIVILLIGWATVAWCGIADTKHNFTSSASSPDAYFTGASQVCAFCHTPHNASNSLAPLGSHQTSGQEYGMYGSPTMDMSQTPQPNDPSLVCLSCHDGTIGVNALNPVPGATGAGDYGTAAGASLDGAGKLTTNSDAYVGVDLSDDHPVGIVYDASQDLENGFATKTGNSGDYPDKLLYLGVYVECSSCHDPHDNTWGSFLVEDNSGSNLCLRCHEK